MTTMTQIPNNEKLIANSSETLDIGQKSGVLKISIAFMAEYMMVQNDTIATLYVEVGETYAKSSNAQVFTPGKYISLPIIEPTQKLTVFWESDEAIGPDSNLVQFYFSNVTIPLSGGNYGSTSTSQNVEILNTITTQFASPQDVNIKSLPALATGANNIGKVDVNSLPALAAGTNNIGKVDVNSLPALSAGTNNIGKVDVNSLPSLPAGTNSIGTIQKQASTDGVLTIESLAITQTTTSADIDVSKLTELALDVNLTAFGGADNTYQLTVNRKGLDGVYYPLYTGSLITYTIQKISVSLGHPNNQSLGNIIQVVETITGTAPSVTRSMSIIGK